jgi:UDP-N-acetylmuramate-alanine ligase
MWIFTPALEDLYLVFVGTTIQSRGASWSCSDDPGVVELLTRISRTGQRLLLTVLAGRNFRYLRLFLSPLHSSARVSEMKILLGEPNNSGITQSLPTPRRLLWQQEKAAPVSQLLGLFCESFERLRASFRTPLKVNRIEVIDDYRHHRQKFGNHLQSSKGIYTGRVLVIFPAIDSHITQAFCWGVCAKALEVADRGVCVGVYLAR